MSTVEEIVDAVTRLDPGEFLRLRRELDLLEARLWDFELEQTSQDLEQAGLSDEEIDRLVLRRRREGRP